MFYIVINQIGVKSENRNLTALVPLIETMAYEGHHDIKYLIDDDISLCKISSGQQTRKLGTKCTHIYYFVNPMVKYSWMFTRII